MSSFSQLEVSNKEATLPPPDTTLLKELEAIIESIEDNKLYKINIVVDKILNFSPSIKFSLKCIMLLKTYKLNSYYENENELFKEILSKLWQNNKNLLSEEFEVDDLNSINKIFNFYCNNHMDELISIIWNPIKLNKSINLTKLIEIY